MKKITLLGVMVGVCLWITGLAQTSAIDISKTEEPLYISSQIKKDIPLGKFINYNGASASLSDFGDKLIIIGFWFTSCTPCIRQFPKENSLQKKYNKDVQFVLVTYEKEDLVKRFIRNWEVKNSTKFRIPVIVEDTILGKVFRAQYNPHYAWVLPGGRVVAQTNDVMINEDTINTALKEATLVGRRIEEERKETKELYHF